MDERRSAADAISLMEVESLVFAFDSLLFNGRVSWIGVDSSIVDVSMTILW